MRPRSNTKDKLICVVKFIVSAEAMRSDNSHDTRDGQTKEDCAAVLWYVVHDTSGGLSRSSVTSFCISRKAAPNCKQMTSEINTCPPALILKICLNRDIFWKTTLNFKVENQIFLFDNFEVIYFLVNHVFSALPGWSSSTNLVAIHQNIRSIKIYILKFKSFC